MYKEITRNYGLRYDEPKYKIYEGDFEVTLREYPPQTRIIKYRNNNAKIESKSLAFPYLQFYYLKKHSSKHTKYYVSGASASVFEGANPCNLYLPNTGHSGIICLADNWQPESIEDIVNKFWFASFSYEIVWPEGNKMIGKEIAFIPNIVFNKTISRKNIQCTASWIPLD